MTTAQKLQAVLAQIGTDIAFVNGKAGALSALTTTQKSNLVAAINELKSLIDGLGASALQIDDTTASATKVFSSEKVSSLVNESISALIAGAPTALDTLNELATALQNADSEITALLTALGNRVRFDAAQTLTDVEKAQARTNIGAVGAGDFSTLSAGMQSDIDALETAQSALEGRVTTAEGEIDTLQSDLSALEDVVDTKASQASVTALTGRVSTAESDIDALETALGTKVSQSAYDTKVAELEASIESLEDISAKQVRVDVAQTFSPTEKTQGRDNIGAASAAGLTALEGRVSTAESDIDALESAVATKASQSGVEALTSRVTTAESDIDSLESRVSAVETVNGTQNALLTSLEIDLAAVQTSNATKASTSSVTALETRVGTAESEIDALQAAADATEDVLAKVVRVDIDQTGVFTSGEKGQARSNIGAASQSDLNATNTRVTAAEGNISTLQSDVDAVENAVISAQSDIDALVSTLGDLEVNFLAAYTTARGTLV